MGKLKSSLPNMLLSLTGICVFSGAILAGINELTKGPIAQANSATLQAAIKTVTPGMEVDLKDAFKAAVGENDSLTIYPAKINGEIAGAAVESNSTKGFNGNISVIVGMDKSGKLLNYSVLQHGETPGLGARMEQWFRDSKNNQSVIGKDLSKGDLKVKKDGGEVDAITAATISSRAFLNAVNRAKSAFLKVEDTSTGATEQVDSTAVAGNTSNETVTAKEGGNEHE